MIDTEFALAASLAGAFAAAGETFFLPYQATGAKTSGLVNGATISYCPGRVMIQVSRTDAGEVYAWTLTVRSDGDGWIGFFTGDTPTDADIERLRTASRNARFDLALALNLQDGRAYGSDVDRVTSIAQMIHVRFPVRTRIAHRGGVAQGARIPGGDHGNS